MADCEHKKASLESTEKYVTITCDSCGEVLRKHSAEHVSFARKFYANAPDDGWILKHCPMELSFMEQFCSRLTSG